MNQRMSTGTYRRHRHKQMSGPAGIHETHTCKVADRSIPLADEGRSLPPVGEGVKGLEESRAILATAIQEQVLAAYSDQPTGRYCILQVIPSDGNIAMVTLSSNRG